MSVPAWQSSVMTIAASLPIEVLAVLRLGTPQARLTLLSDPSTSDATRLAFNDDADSLVRATAVRGAKSDATRLAFKDDADAWVRAEAVRGAKSDATRLAFKGDANAWVRVAAVSGAKSDATRLAFKGDANAW